MIHTSRRREGARERVRTSNKHAGARLGERLDGRGREASGGALLSTIWYWGELRGVRT